MGWSGNNAFKDYPHVERMVVLIDGNNVLKGAQNFSNGFKIDHKKLVNFLTGDNKLIRAYFFDCSPEKGQQSMKKNKNLFVHLGNKE